MRTLRASAPLIVACVLGLFPSEDLGAQAVLGPGPEAVTLPAGTLRTTLLSESILFRGRWNEGSAEDLGGGFIGGLAAPQSSWLAALQVGVNAIGPGAGEMSLGNARLDLRQRLAMTTLGLEFGITDRLSVSIAAPFVRARAEAQLRSDSTGATAGVNPMLTATGVPAANRATIDAFTAAVTNLAARQGECAGNPAAYPECGDILAEGSQVTALLTLTQGFANGLANLYGAQGLATGLPFVPLAGSAPEQTLLARVDSLRTAFTRYGVGNLATTGLPLGAQTSLTAEQLAALVADPVNGYGARSTARTARQDLGDVDIGVRFKLFDSFSTESARLTASRFGIRQTIALTYRLGGGAFDLPDNFIDLGTGSGHDAIGLRSFTDVVVNERFWTTVSLGWAKGAEHSRVLRVPSVAGSEWIEPWRTSSVTITPGNVVDLRIAPRWQLSDYYSFGAEWRFRSKSEDAHTLATTSGVDPLGVLQPLDAGVLDAQSEWNEQRFALTVSYSTLGAVSRGKARLPIEIAYAHEQSIASSAGIVPRRWEDRLQLRYYTRFFGR